MKYIFFFAIFFLFFSCNRVDLEYVKSKSWNHDSGFRVGEGDFIILKGDQKIFELKNDTIFYKGNPRALVQSLDKKNYNLIISSIDHQSIGVYRNDEESLR